MSTHDETPPLCPSAQPDMAGSAVFAVIGGSVDQPRAGYLAQALPVTDALLAMTAPAHPTEVLRFSAPCAASACQHFSDNRCNLAARVTRTLPAVTDALPACRLRPDCRWWRQEGKEACLRCPQVVTQSWRPSDEFKQAAAPQPLPLVELTPRG